MNYSLTEFLVDKLESCKPEYHISDDQAKHRIMNNLYKDLSEKYDAKVVDNISRIIDHFAFDQKVTLDNIIRFMHVNFGLDYHTILREERDNFDARFGTVTSPIIPQYEIPESVSIKRFQGSGRYHPSPIASVCAGLDALAKMNVTYSDFTFFDIGSGLGRNLLLASSYSFSKIIGIEHSQYLNDSARKNIDSYLAKTHEKDVFELYCIDALEYSYPAGNVVFYFWHPFSDEVAELFFNKIEAFYKELPVRVVLIFLGPLYPVLESSLYFSISDRFFTTDVFFSANEFFKVTIYSGGHK
jgi:hypothetical protein